MNQVKKVELTLNEDKTTYSLSITGNYLRKTTIDKNEYDNITEATITFPKISFKDEDFFEAIKEDGKSLTFQSLADLIKEKASTFTVMDNKELMTLTIKDSEFELETTEKNVEED